MKSIEVCQSGFEFASEVLADLIFAGIEKCKTQTKLKSFLQTLWVDGEVMIIPLCWGASNSDSMAMIFVIDESAAEREKQKALWLADFLLSLDGSRSLKFDYIQIAYSKEHPRVARS